ncbi:MAG: hypothetical protein ACREM2_02945, partial [Vulcanimicrobiaceae bacterium]
ARGRRGGRGRRGTPATPSPSPSPGGAEPSPTATPTSPAYASLDGTWEVQIQYHDRTDYSYFDLIEAESGALSGDWRVGGKKYPLTGTYDGRLIRFVAQEPALAVTFSGYVDEATDMVGMADFGPTDADAPAFTAEHRSTEKPKIL